MKKILSLLLALAIAFGSPPSFAGYAQLKPPPGWSQGLSAAVPGQAGVFAFGPAANYSSFKGSTVLTNAALSVAGQYVVVPVSMRLAANAATVAAEYSFGNPLLFAGILAGTAAYNYYSNQGFTIKDGKWVKKDYQTNCPGGTCYEYSYDQQTWGSFSSACAAGQAARVPTDPRRTVTWSGPTGENTCAGTFYYTPDGGVKAEEGPADFGVARRLSNEVPVETVRPVTKPEFHTIMDPLSLPSGFPQSIPEAPLPYEKPIFNPNPANIPTTNPTPSTPASRPIWVPTGDPVPASPATAPQTWTQPGKNVVGSPTATDPWRVDVIDAPITKTNATPNTAPVTTPEPVTPTPQTDLLTCGLPGKPPCLIDESGTPEKVAPDVYKPQLDDYKTKQGELTDKASGNSDKSFFSGWSSVFFTPPLAACTGYVLPRDMGTIDPCPVVDGVRTIMGYIWALTALFLAVGMIKKVV